MLANELKQSNLSVEAAYADLAETQKRAEEEANTITQEELYAKSPLRYKEIVSLANTWVQNNIGTFGDELERQYRASYNAALNAYGQEYADLWENTVVSAWDQAKAGPAPLDVDDFIKTWENNIFSDRTVTTGDEYNNSKVSDRVADPDQQKKAYFNIQQAFAQKRIDEYERSRILNALKISQDQIKQWEDEVFNN